MRRLWILLASVCLVEFAVLGWMGVRIWQAMPPIPERVVADGGETVVSDGDIARGQNVWQTLGGMDVGSVWGHGGYVAPDWTADWLHREAESVLDQWARRDHGMAYDELPPETQAALRERLTRTFRANRYDPATRTLTIEPERALAFASNLRHYTDVFSNGKSEYAIPKAALTDPERLRQLASFFFWSAWAATAVRPGEQVSFTSNWPHEPLVGNRPTGDAVVWTGVSVLVLLAGIGAFVWYYAGLRADETPESVPSADPMVGLRVTPSQSATIKYFVVVAALLLLQILTGVITAHYSVEGDSLYGIPLSRWLPYSVTRTWHLQLGLFWIATSWLAAGLFIGPLVSGREPRGQRFGVNVLFGALLLVVLGSLAGEWASIHGHLSDAMAFYFGDQGYEYIELGRVWQIALFVGLLLWLVLMLRAIGPALRGDGESRPLVAIFALSAGAIALFYGAGLMWGRHTHLSMVEYWRWWVVHLWVEGFFEVFATTVIAFLFARLGLLRPKLAAEASLAAAAIYLAGGIVGTAHHLYFAGTPTAVLALGATFSALEVVPLVLIGRSAMKDLHTSRAAPWAHKIPLARLLLRRRGLLEPGGRGALRLHDQSPDRPLLHAGPQHDAGPRARRPLRRIRNAGPGSHADVPARPASRPGLARGPAEIRLLGHEPGPAGADRPLPAAPGPGPDLGLGERRLLVRPQPGPPRPPPGPDPEVDASARRHALRPGRDRPGALRIRAPLRLVGRRSRPARVDDGDPEPRERAYGIVTGGTVARA